MHRGRSKELQQYIKPTYYGTCGASGPSGPTRVSGPSGKCGTSGSSGTGSTFNTTTSNYNNFVWSGSSTTTSNYNTIDILTNKNKSVIMNLNKIDGISFKKNIRSKVSNALVYA